jgi:hypothetical protein
MHKRLKCGKVETEELFPLRYSLVVKLSYLKYYNVMNEIILVIVVVTLMLVIQVALKKMRKPILLWVRVVAALLLMILVWICSDKENIPVKALLSIVVLSSLYKEFFSKKLQPEPDRK